MFALLLLAQEVKYEWRWSTEDLGISQGVLALINIISYFLGAIIWFKIAQKTGTPNAWMAFIPILNVILFFNCGGRSGWWLLSALIFPLFIIMTIVNLVSVFQRCGRSGWWVLTIFVPIVLLIMMFVIAFEKRPVTAPPVVTAV